MGVRSVVAGLVALMWAACAPPGPDAFDAADAEDVDSFFVLPDFADEPQEQEGLLWFSNGYREGPLLAFPENFNHCEPDRDGDISLTAARWMAAFSYNEYSHYANVGPYLQSLGFGDDDVGQRWRERAVYIQILRLAEKMKDDAQLEKSLGEFAPRIKDFVADLAERRLPTQPGVLENFLLQAVHGEGIEFFSAGDLNYDGVFLDGSTQLVWAYHPKEHLAVIAFRGTQEAEDIYTNLDSRTTALIDARPEWGMVHRGFLDALTPVEPLIRGQIELQLEADPDTKFVVTGHSLGGALATLTAARILEWNQRGDGPHVDLRGLYTFGSPRVGDATFAARFTEEAAAQNVPALRFRFLDDPVTKVPFIDSWIADFAHVGRLVLLDDGVVHSDGSPLFGPEFELGEDGTPVSKVGLEDLDYSLLDCSVNVETCTQMHLMDSYYAAIELAWVSAPDSERCGMDPTLTPLPGPQAP